MQERIPRAQLVVAAPAKHMGPLKCNREYNAAMPAFAKRCFEGEVLESRRFDGPSRDRR